jgi:uncharacterized protein YndB with AHSA1/START domain
MKFNDSIIINKPADQVFACWSDVERYPEWAEPVIERRKLTDGPVGAGSRFHAVDQWPGRRIAFEMEITEFVENESLSARWSEPLAGSWSSRLVDTPDGTRFDFETEMQLPLLMRPMTPFLKPWAKKQNRKFMENLKNQVENGPQ